MKTAKVNLESFAPYSQSQKHETPKKEKELEDAYAKRTFRQFLHVNSDGFVFIPAMAFNKCIQTAIKFMREKIPGKGTSEYGKHFMGGMTCQQEGLVLPLKPEQVEYERLYLNADGVPGGNKRVWRYYPVIPAWKGMVEFFIFDETITNDIFAKTLTEGGYYIGIGRFRAEKGGLYGRFKILNIEWTE